MADAVITPNPEAKANGDRSDRIPRGSAPPALKLSDAVELAKKINEQASGSASYDLFSQITGNSRTSSTFLRKLSSLRQYKIIQDIDNVATLSDIGTRIAAPLDTGDDLAAIKQAMLEVDNLSKLFDRVKGRILPEDQFLKNIMVQELKIPREVCDLWIAWFKDAANSARLLLFRPDGKTQVLEGPSFTPKISADTTVPANRREETVVPQQSALPVAATTNSFENNPDLVLIQLGPRRLAKLQLPSDWDSAKDLKRLLKMLQLALSEEIPEDDQK
jgi:hypothetical protein